LVHNTFSAQADIHEAAAKNCFFCLCPNANLFIENKLPDYSIFKSCTNNLCIGTDSLASNYKLDLLSEANLILKNTHTFSLENILQMLTFNGAFALNLHNSFGQLLINKNTGLNLISFIDSEIKLLKKII
jgi:cytosine/adenosine deaminase-related metal-dependent hydrolase